MKLYLQHEKKAEHTQGHDGKTNVDKHRTLAVGVRSEKALAVNPNGDASEPKTSKNTRSTR